MERAQHALLVRWKCYLYVCTWPGLTGIFHFTWGGGKAAVPLGKMLPSTPQPGVKPLAQWDSQATEAPPNAQAKFTDGWVKLKPMASPGLLWLFSVNASCEEWKTDVVAPLRRQNSKPPSQLQPVGLVNLVIFSLTLGLLTMPSCLVGHLENYRLAG